MDDTQNWPFSANGARATLAWIRGVHANAAVNG
jgi:hypothetical protein